MQIIELWQRNYIEKSLREYEKLRVSTLRSDVLMVAAIDYAREYFKGCLHEKMVENFYFVNPQKLKRSKEKVLFLKFCSETLYISETQGYKIRIELINKIALACYSFDLFKIEIVKKGEGQ